MAEKYCFCENRVWGSLAISRLSVLGSLTLVEEIQSKRKLRTWISSHSPRTFSQHQNEDNLGGRLSEKNIYLRAMAIGNFKRKAVLLMLYEESGTSDISSWMVSPISL